MTLNQLLKEVSALGFNGDVELGEAFVFNVNRAIRMLFTELGPQKRAKISINATSQKSFDLSDHVNDAMVITAPPKDSIGNVINGAYSDGLFITLPDSFLGDAVITYRSLPKALTQDDGDTVLDIPAYIEHLLPLLTAFFVHLDDDPEKAEAYMSIYRSEAKRIWMLFSPAQNNSYNDVTGWAT